MAQWVKDLVLLQLWHRMQLHLRFDTWSRNNFHMLKGQPKKKKKKERERERERELRLIESYTRYKIVHDFKPLLNTITIAFC